MQSNPDIEMERSPVVQSSEGKKRRNADGSPIVKSKKPRVEKLDIGELLCDSIANNLTTHSFWLSYAQYGHLEGDIKETMLKGEVC